jgi:hypothetical protein
VTRPSSAAPEGPHRCRCGCRRLGHVVLEAISIMTSRFDVTDGCDLVGSGDARLPAFLAAFFMRPRASNDGRQHLHGSVDAGLAAALCRKYVSVGCPARIAALLSWSKLIMIGELAHSGPLLRRAPNGGGGGAPTGRAEASRSRAPFSRIDRLPFFADSNDIHLDEFRGRAQNNGFSADFSGLRLLGDRGKAHDT